MIAEVAGRGKRGSNTLGLLRYLFGRGRSDEHRDPHIVAAWDPDWVRGGAWGEDTTTAPGRARLAQQLDALMAGHEVDLPDGHVYHVVLSIPPTDVATAGYPPQSEAHTDEDGKRPTQQRLPDEVWRELVESGIAALGLGADDDGQGGCRWVAVHHGLSTKRNDHVHVVVNVVRGDGQVANLHRDFLRWRDWCRQVEEERGWTRTAPAGEGRSKPTSRVELVRADASGQRTERDRLRDVVTTVAAEAADEIGFVLGLRRSGVLVAAYPDTGPVTGYKVALRPEQHAVEQDRPAPEPLWFAGSTLRRDLSLPRLRARWPDPRPLPASRQQVLWRDLADHPVDPQDRIGGTSEQTLRRELGRVRAAVEAAIGTAEGAIPAPDLDQRTWHLFVERSADLLAVVRSHDPHQLLDEVYDQLTRAAQLPRSVATVGYTASSSAKRSSTPIITAQVALRLLTDAARIAASVRDVTPVVLALVAVTVLGIITALHAVAERRAIREAARQQLDAAVAVLEEHPARNVLLSRKPPVVRQPVMATPSAAQPGPTPFAITGISPAQRTGCTPSSTPIPTE
ncbi:relaxase/mobilization nuclease domain-containing protein [Saccharothrix mutabilis subsp. mutabilis]|uniref:Relaxase/mobilization nuclease domain-containing protein n=1 Tax=Saccharothrix mutabilis subsp. mutabilis TaxID=66855 RepID=A0ABN0UWX0_9PSEU